MSGGHFDYGQSRMEWEIAQPLFQVIAKNKKRPDWIDEDAWERDYKGQMWSDETIAEFKKGLDALRLAYIYAQRIDWLLSGDDGEETFHKRLKCDLENYQFNLYEQDCDDDS